MLLLFLRFPIAFVHHLLSGSVDLLLNSLRYWLNWWFLLLLKLPLTPLVVIHIVIFRLVTLIVSVFLIVVVIDLWVVGFFLYRLIINALLIGNWLRVIVIIVLTMIELLRSIRRLAIPRKFRWLLSLIALNCHLLLWTLEWVVWKIPRSLNIRSQELMLYRLFWSVVILLFLYSFRILFLNKLYFSGRVLLIPSWHGSFFILTCGFITCLLLKLCSLNELLLGSFRFFDNILYFRFLPYLNFLYLNLAVLLFLTYRFALILTQLLLLLIIICLPALSLILLRFLFSIATGTYVLYCRFQTLNFFIILFYIVDRFGFFWKRWFIFRFFLKKFFYVFVNNLFLFPFILITFMLILRLSSHIRFCWKIAFINYFLNVVQQNLFFNILYFLNFFYFFYFLIMINFLIIIFT